ncbi:MAG: hypothetical protein ACP5D6_10290, partial [Kosmotogaceae bacterium]
QPTIVQRFLPLKDAHTQPLAALSERALSAIKSFCSLYFSSFKIRRWTVDEAKRWTMDGILVSPSRFLNSRISMFN